MCAPPCSSMHAHSLHNFAPLLSTHSGLSSICLSTASDRWPTPYSGKCILVRCSGFPEVKIPPAYLCNAAPKITTHAMFLFFKFGVYWLEGGRGLCACEATLFVALPAGQHGRSAEQKSSQITVGGKPPRHRRMDTATSTPAVRHYHRTNMHCAESD